MSCVVGSLKPRRLPHSLLGRHLNNPPATSQASLLPSLALVIRFSLKYMSSILYGSVKLSLKFYLLLLHFNCVRVFPIPAYISSHLFRVFLSPFECRSDLCGAVFLSFCIKYYARAVPPTLPSFPLPAHWKYFDFTFIEI